ncbi:MAG: WD40/YVTN/BNR-like repeat-containing protein [Rhodothermales bacterium]
MNRRCFCRFSLIGLAALWWMIPGPLHAQPSDDALFQTFQWRNIGPANMGGRIVDLEAVETDFTHVFLASASGGVWKSVNAGTTWEPIFDAYSSASIGDLALFQPDPDILWVGTGEANNRNSVSWGDGVYKSVDGGGTFAHMGLEDTHQIARIITHLTDPDVAYVCAIGHLWGYTGDRGLFKTTDGGETWEKLAGGLPDDGRTGCTDLVMHPGDAGVLYTAFYHRLRQPWTFHSGGPNGGIFKSVDGGQTWQKLTNGLPEGDTGRIGLAVYRQNPDIVMALVEAARTNDLSVPGSGVYRSEDGGASWVYVNTYNNRPFYYSQIRINPQNDQRVYLLTTRFMVSEDGGRTLRNGSEDQEVHGDFHAMWLDPTNADRYYLGADKGASLTHDHGTHFLLFDNLPLGQFYRIGVDMRDPYYVYGGLQDNGTYGVASFSRDARGILNDVNWKLHWGDGQDIQPDPTDWRTLYTEMENGNSFRYDVPTHRITSIRPRPQTITNYHDVLPDSLRQGGREFRFNWSAPLVMSPHNPQMLFAGGNHLFKTVDQGETWTIISPDLTTNDLVKRIRGQSGGITPDNSGAEHHCTITSVAPSAVTPEVIWVGTDDGNVQVTRDGGHTWTNVRSNIAGVPEGIWVSRVEASHFDAGTAYVSFDGHRSDTFTPWIFKTTDYGRSWANLAEGLPDGQVVRVIREDVRNPNLLFAGTEFALYLSLDGGERWVRLMNNLPTVSVLDLVVHPRDNDLVAGTHGRSLWMLDDITPLQQLTESVLASEAYLFEQRPATLWENTSRGGQRGHFWFAGDNPSTIERTSSVPRAGFRNTALISYFLGTQAGHEVTLEISDLAGTKTHVAVLENKPGIHRYRWDLQFDPEPLTEAQIQHVEAIFQRLLAQTSFGALRRAYQNFQQAQTPLNQRRAVQILRSGFFDAGLGEEYGIPTAGPGSYRLTLSVGPQQHTRTLTVRADPLITDR